MNIKNTKLTSSEKKILDLNVSVVFTNSKIKVFSVSSKEGIFTVIDYVDRFSSSPDTEIYYTRYTDPLSVNSAEYKKINNYVTSYLKDKKDT